MPGAINPAQIEGKTSFTALRAESFTALRAESFTVLRGYGVRQWN